jgi:hypothetical protein
MYGAVQLLLAAGRRAVRLRGDGTAYRGTNLPDLASRAHRAAETSLIGASSSPLAAADRHAGPQRTRTEIGVAVSRRVRHPKHL